jgi:hypothetical protein
MIKTEIKQKLDDAARLIFDVEKLFTVGEYPRMEGYKARIQINNFREAIKNVPVPKLIIHEALTSDKQAVLAETKLAYCDSTMNWTQSCKLRNLNFIASAPVSVDDAVKIMTESLGLKSATEKGYNNFAPGLLRKLPKGSQVILAREGSVCVYVKLPTNYKNISDRIRQSLDVDECDIQPDGMIRLWWD